MVDCWNNADCLAKLTKYVPYLFIFLGFLVAVFGQFVKTKIDNRVAGLRESKEAERKSTSPAMDVLLGRSSSTGEILLEIDAQNGIPFKADWLVATKRNVVVSGILMTKQEIFSYGTEKEVSVQSIHQ